MYSNQTWLPDSPENTARRAELGKRINGPRIRWQVWGMVYMIPNKGRIAGALCGVCANGEVVPELAVPDLQAAATKGILLKIMASQTGIEGLTCLKILDRWVVGYIGPDLTITRLFPGTGSETEEEAIVCAWERINWGAK